MDENREMYQEEILELYKHPRNFGKLREKTHSFHGANASCGDDILVDLEVRAGIVKDAKFQGNGCALCVASASLLIDHIKGKNVESVKKMDEKVIRKLLGIEVNPGRMKCVMLSLDSVQGALGGRDA